MGIWRRLIEVVNWSGRMTLVAALRSHTRALGVKVHWEHSWFWEVKGFDAEHKTYFDPKHKVYEVSFPQLQP